MKRSFLTGVMFLLPFAVSVLIVLWLVDLLTDPFLELAQHSLFLKDSSVFQALHPTVSLLLTRAFILAFLFFFTLFLGFLGRKYLVSKILTSLQKLFLKLPLIRVIYKLCHDVTKATLTADSKIFKQTVLVSFPQEDSLALGLVTGTIPPCLQKEGTDVEIAVFVPTSPHPMSGFLLLTPRKLVKPIDLSTEEAFQYIISCGTISNIQKAQPPQNHA